MVQNLCIRTFFGIIKHYNTSNAMHNAKLFIILSTKLYILMTNILYIYIYILPLFYKFACLRSIAFYSKFEMHID